MEKRTIIAMVGTLALALNLVLPSLVMGQTNDQTGSLSLGCGGVAFNLIPSNFSFSEDGLGGGVTSPLTQISVYSNGNGGLASLPAQNRLITVRDLRDFNQAGCDNNGFSVTAVVIDDPTADGKYFASGVNGDGDSIPLSTTAGEDDGLLVASTTLTQDGAPSNFSVKNGTNGRYIEYANTQYKGSDPQILLDLGLNTNFATYATFTDKTGNNLGTAADTPSSAITLFRTVDAGGPTGNDNALYGEIGVAPVYATQIPGLQPAGSDYTLYLQYELQAY